jgi:hypothetical protein
MTNIFMLTNNHTPLADDKSEILENIEPIPKSNNSINLNCTMDDANAIIIQEKISFKNFRYIPSLKNDPIFKKYANKIFTINSDDCATGLIKGLYTSLPKKRYNPEIHSVIPYSNLPNELTLIKESEIKPKFLASWRGNPKSNKIRNKIIKLFNTETTFDIQSTNSWFNHNTEEKQLYKNSLNNAKFSLCPAGWAPVTFRIYESMAAGKCPVIIADQFVPPAGPDWETFSVFIPENNVNNLKQILEKLEFLYDDLGEKAHKNWKKFFSPSNVYNYYTTQLIKLIQTSVLSTVQSEFQRWDSYHMHFNNNWTVPQRFINKLKKSLPLFNSTHRIKGNLA